MKQLKFLKLFKNFFSNNTEEKHMDYFSQEHLDKLLKRQEYLRALVQSVNKKINHRNWSVAIDYGTPALLPARATLIAELTVVAIEIDFLVGYLKE